MDQSSNQPPSDQGQTDTDTQSVQTPPVEPNAQDATTTDTPAPTDQETATQSSPTPTVSNDQESQQTVEGKDEIESENYVENVGGDQIGLLDEISGSDQLLGEVAEEMLLDKEKVKAILTGLLNKIDQGQITTEEIALILASTVVDELGSDEEIL